MAKKNNGNRRIRFRRLRGNIITTVVNTATAILGNPLFLISIAVSLYLYTNPDVIKTFCKKFEKSTLLKPIFDFISQRALQTAGFVLSGTACLTTLPSRFSFAGFIILGFVCYLLPAANYFEYFMLTASTILFIRIRNIKARIIVVVLIIITLALGWWGLKLFALGDPNLHKDKISCEAAGATWNSSTCK